MNTLVAILVVFLWAAGEGPPRDAIVVRGGQFTPLYGAPADQQVEVAPFRIDRFPVTNEAFHHFTEQRPEWRPGKALRLIADEHYLEHWRDGRPSDAELKSPVVRVSWFAANDFCVWNGGRLPSTLEWEFVAAASETTVDASRDPEFIQRILSWYSRPHESGRLPAVGQGAPNIWGIHDLHGLVWEWTADFNTIFAVGDNRQDGELSRNMFCGDAAVGATDRANYAGFMRYALRNSLEARFTTPSLGFRCAYDIREEDQSSNEEE